MVCKRRGGIGEWIMKISKGRKDKRGKGRRREGKEDGNEREICNPIFQTRITPLVSAWDCRVCLTVRGN
jgi:hypothetical protein